jgi:hypothetical protein
MQLRDRSRQTKRYLKRFDFKFMLTPGKIAYSRQANVDPGSRLIDVVRFMLPNLVRQHPELFSDVTSISLQKWRYFYGFENDVQNAEELDSQLSINELGIFPESTIILGPASCFR